METPAIVLALAAVIFGGMASAGQWTVVKDATVEVHASKVVGKVRNCTVKAGGKLYSAPREPATVLGYHRSGITVSGECDATVHRVEVPPNRLSEFARRDW